MADVKVEFHGLEEAALAAALAALEEESLKRAIAAWLERTGTLPAFAWSVREPTPSNPDEVKFMGHAADTAPAEPGPTVYTIRDTLSIEEFQRVRAGQAQLPRRPMKRAAGNS